MKKVLITGARGFIGRHTAKHFSDHGYRVVGIGHGHWGFDNPEHYGIDRWIEADIDFAALAEIRDKIDCIVHCAGGSSVGYSCQYPLQDFIKTVDTTANVLEYTRIHQPDAKLIYPSSAAVYGKKSNQQIKVKAPLDPLSPYGYHKKMVEGLCASYARNFDLCMTIIRFFSIYGPGLHKQLLWDACNKFSESQGRVEFYGSGEETRDWLHVDDAAALIRHMAEMDSRYETLNGGYGQATTIREVVSKLATHFDREIQVEFNRQSKAGDPEHYWADILDAQRFGWQPTISLDHGLQEYVNWFREQVGR
jgi:UDP-glucose 4-epimerase